MTQYVYTITLPGMSSPSGTYTGLKKLCDDFGIDKKIYYRIWRRVKKHGVYKDRKYIINRLPLIKSDYTKR